MAGSATILRADARHLPLADGSVDLIVTSPPYYALRSYTDGGQHYGGQIGAEPTPAEYIDSLIDCTREWMRVLKPGGSIWVNLGDKYAGAGVSGGTSKSTLAGASNGRPRDMREGTFHTGHRVATGAPAKSLLLLPERYRIACVDELRLIARQVQIWSKPNGLPESVTDRTRRSHEDWVHLVKQPRYFAAVDEIRTPASGYQRPGKAARATSPGVKPRAMADTCNPLGALPGSVWEIPTEPLTVPDHLGVDHFAAFPTEWPRRIILGWSPAGGVVLDPFSGTGTTALVAKSLGRHGIGSDRSADYCRLATWRTTDPGELAKAMRVPKPPKPLDGQGVLFAEIFKEAESA